LVHAEGDGAPSASPGTTAMSEPPGRWKGDHGLVAGAGGQRHCGKAKAPALPERVAPAGPLPMAGDVFDDGASDVDAEVFAIVRPPSPQGGATFGRGDLASTSIPDSRWWLRGHSEEGGAHCHASSARGLPPSERGREEEGDRCHASGAHETRSCEPFADDRTTVILQKIPETLDGEGMKRALDALGFSSRYDAVYVPMKDPPNGRNLGYGFVNFVGPSDAAACIRTCTGKPFGDASPRRVCVAAYAKNQGAMTSARAEARARKERKAKRKTTEHP